MFSFLETSSYALGLGRLKARIENLEPQVKSLFSDYFFIPQGTADDNNLGPDRLADSKALGLNYSRQQTLLILRPFCLNVLIVHGNGLRLFFWLILILLMSSAMTRFGPRIKFKTPSPYPKKINKILAHIQKD